MEAFHHWNDGRTIIPHADIGRGRREEELRRRRRRRRRCHCVTLTRDILHPRRSPASAPEASALLDPSAGQTAADCCRTTAVCSSASLQAPLPKRGAPRGRLNPSRTAGPGPQAPPRPRPRLGRRAPDGGGGGGPPGWTPRVAWVGGWGARGRGAEGPSRGSGWWSWWGSRGRGRGRGRRGRGRGMARSRCQHCTSPTLSLRRRWKSLVSLFLGRRPSTPFLFAPYLFLSLPAPLPRVRPPLMSRVRPPVLLTCLSCSAHGRNGT